MCWRLNDACYYLNVEKTRYKFSLKENLNKRFADRRATVQGPQIDEEVKQDIQRIFARKELIERAFFPEKSIQVPDRPVVTVLISDLTRTMEDEKATKAFANQIVRESGTSARKFKSALIWVVPESARRCAKRQESSLLGRRSATRPKITGLGSEAATSGNIQKSSARPEGVDLAQLQERTAAWQRQHVKACGSGISAFQLCYRRQSTY